MLRVYNYMAIGLVLTGVVAYGHLFRCRSTMSAARSYADRRSARRSSAARSMWVVILAPLALVFFLSFRISR